METIKQKLSEQLTNAGYSDFEFVRIDDAPTISDANGKPFYEKRRLLTIFKNRLKGCLLHDPQNGMIDFLKDSIETLESIADDSEIFYWQIVANGKQVSGRSTEQQILHIFPDHEESVI
jgi:hypothetical protein